MSNTKHAKAFRNILFNGKLDLILEAHSGLSAKVVEETGYPAIWASGLSISSLLGLRDCNEASWGQVVSVTESIYDSVDIPIFFDGDSGFGNFNNVRHIVKRLSHYGIAGISLEDKLFPKMNSFISGEHSLTPINEFTGKIKAAQDSKSCDDFVVVARTESLISGMDVDISLERANKYYEAGADAIFIHSKKNDGEEILDFARQWDKRCPLVVAPTTYTEMPISILEDAGVSVYICANHLMRASLHNMKSIANQIKKQQSIHHLDSKISSLDDVFSLLNYDELDTAENKYGIID
ncbi:phosphoenolpyruvate mutase [Vibrio mediterranei]|uniref:phosphoenolpyruvate mutase n=1 Tax=Vibrio mediterranei TaxID=689 RepID=UPI0038CEB07D